MGASGQEQKRIAVLGCGRVGAAIVADLAKDGEFWVRAVDAHDASLAAVAKRGKPTELRRVDLANPRAVAEAVEGVDLVVGAVPGFMGFETLRAVLEAGRDVVDISFFDEDAFLLDDLAKQRGCVAVVDCGVAPGVSNLVAGHWAERLERMDRFGCWVGGLPAVRTQPWEYKAGFSPIDVLEEYTRPARLVERGEVVVRPALSEIEPMEFPGLGTLEAFNSDGLRSLLRTLDAPWRVEKTLRYPGHAAKMQLLRDAGFFDKGTMRVGGADVRPLDVAAALLFPAWQFAPGEEDFTVMRIVVEGVERGTPVRHVYDLLDRYDRASATTSMARTTGYTATAAVRWVTSGGYRRPGISPPEHIGREEGGLEFIVERLRERGVNLEHRVEKMETT